MFLEHDPTRCKFTPFMYLHGKYKESLDMQALYRHAPGQVTRTHTHPLSHIYATLCFRAP